MPVMVEEPYVPPRLYRYRSLGDKGSLVEREILAITSQNIWCSTYDSMNDPMEGYFIPRDSRIGMQEEYHTILDRIRYHATELELACFSETYESELMWAHYGGNYSGICIGYSTKELREGLQGHAYLAKIAYVDEPPKLDFMQYSESEKPARVVLSLKKSNWAYEQAVRTINFGARIDKSARSDFISRLTDPNIKFFQMTVSGYKHDWSPLSIAT